MIRLLTSDYKNNKEKATKLAQCVGLMDAPCGFSSIISCGNHNFCKYCEGADYEVSTDLKRLFIFARKLALSQVESKDEALKMFEELLSYDEKKLLIENYKEG